MKQQTTRILFNYWNEVRGPRPAPRRLEIEPARIAAILPESFILERISVSCYRYRLAGTRICEQFGAELRGRNFLDTWNEQDRAQLVGRLAMIVSDAAVGLIEFEVATPHGRAAYEAVLVPLIQAGSRIDRILGAISAIDAPEWLGGEQPPRCSLLRHEVIWPERTLPAAPTPKLSRPGERVARLVNVARRQFRVYEGGRAEHDASAGGEPGTKA